MDMQRIKNLIEEKREQMISDMVELSSIPSVNPRMGGTGEYERIIWIKNWFDVRNIPCEIYEIPDTAVKEGVRLNLVVTVPGKKTQDNSLWFISHVDTVGPGDLDAWETDPFKPVVKDGRIYGLGCEDNSQSVIATMYVCEMIFSQRLQMDRNIRFYYASDEETGSEYGMKALLDKGLIRPGDEAIVPDGGSSDGSLVEIAEKSQVWLKFTVNGKTSHAAMPQLGINACYIGMRFGSELEDRLKERFSNTDELFNPPMSTFEVTQKFENVASPNVMPGKDSFCMDLRILPEYPVDTVMAFIRDVIKEYEMRYSGITIDFEFLTRSDAPAPTEASCDIVKNMIEAIREDGTEAYYGGIGGGTCAAILRRKGVASVVWSTLDDMCHTPNEYVVIDNLLRDTRVYMSVLSKYEA